MGEVFTLTCLILNSKNKCTDSFHNKKVIFLSYAFTLTSVLPRNVFSQLINFFLCMPSYMKQDVLLVTSQTALEKKAAESNSRKDWFILAHSLKLQSLVAKEAWLQALRAAGHVIFTVRRQRNEYWRLAHLS